jgi:hypothetical protein
MRKTIIFGAIAALFGLVAAAQASDDDARPGMKDRSHFTRHVETEGRGDMAERTYRERDEARERDDDAYEHGKEAHERGHEAREREHRSGAYEDRD